MTEHVCPRDMSLDSLDDLISEREVYQRYGHLFVTDELRQARQSRQLECFELRKGIFYTQAQLLSYLETRRRKQCQNRPLLEPQSDPQNASGSSRTNGSARKPVHLISTDTSTRETDALVAKALEQRT